MVRMSDWHFRLSTRRLALFAAFSVATLLGTSALSKSALAAETAPCTPVNGVKFICNVTNVEDFALSPDTRKILEGMGHKFGPPQPANHLAVIIVGAPSLGGKPVGKNRFYGANDPRRNSGLALGY